MIEGPKVKGNPLRIAVGLLILSYVVGEFVIPKYPLIYALKLIGILCFIFSILIFSLIEGFLTRLTKINDLSKTILRNPFMALQCNLQLWKSDFLSYLLLS